MGKGRVGKGEGKGGEGGREKEGGRETKGFISRILLFEPVLGSSVDSLPEVLNYLAYCSLDHSRCMYFCLPTDPWCGSGPRRAGAKL